MKLRPRAHSAPLDRISPPDVSTALHQRACAIVVAIGIGALAGAAPANFDVDVNLVVIDVVVTGEDGLPRRGLTAEDFVLTEDGEPQVITDCDEVRADGGAEPASGEITGRRFVLFFDTAGASPNQMARAKEAARDLIGRSIQPSDLVSILSYGASLRLHQDFTSDRALLERALEPMGHGGNRRTEAYHGQTAQSVNPHQEQSGLGGPQYFTPEEDGMRPGSEAVPLQDAVAHARLEELQAAERMQKAIALIGTTLAHTPGRKALVLFTTGGEILPTANRSPSAYRAMVDALNRANVAVYPVDAGGGSGSTPGDVQAEVGYATGFLGQPSDNQRRSRGDRRSGMESVAADTGGQALVGGDMTRRLEEMAASTSHYYMLGYTPGDLVRSGFRDVKVTVRVPGARVLARKGYVRPRPFAELGKREREKQLEDAFGAWTGIEQIPVDIRTDFYPDSARRTTVALELALPPAAVCADVTGGRFEVVARVFRPSGRKVEEHRRMVTLSEVEASRAVRYVEGITLKPGNYILKAVVRDDVSGNMGTAVARFKIPEFAKDGPIVSTPVLLAPESTAKLVSSEASARVVSGYSLGGERLLPVSTGSLAPAGEAVCHFRAMNLRLDPLTSHPRLIVSYTMTRGDELVLRQLVHYKIEGEVDPEIGAPVHVRIPLERLSPGEHRLEVLAYDVIASKAIRSDVAFTIVAP